MTVSVRFSWRSLIVLMAGTLGILAVACGGDSGSGPSQSRPSSDPTSVPSSAAPTFESTAAPSESTPSSPGATATPPVVPKFEISADSGQAPFAPVITNLSQNSDSFTWDFGDGSETSSTESPSHTYTKSGSFVLKLTVGGGGTLATFTQTITVEAGPLANVQISPAQAAVAANESIAFSANGADEFGNEIGNIDLVWSASEDAGSIDAAGLFTATTVAGEYVQSITATAGGGQQATVGVVVDPGSPSEISLEPAIVALDIGASQQITLKVADEFGNEISDPLASWKIDSEIGSINADGLVTAGTKAGVYPEGIRVDVVSGTAALFATVVLGVETDPLASITVLPALAIVRKNETLKLEAAGVDQYGNTIPNLRFLWDSGDLNVDSTGKVIAGGQEGLYQITVRASHGGSEKSSTFNVGVPPVFMPLEDMNKRRRNHTATLLKDGRVFLFGGGISGSEIFDPATLSFIPGATTARSVNSHSATLLQDGTVLITGGCSSNQALIFDPATEILTTIPGGIGDNRDSHATTLLENGDVLITGGRPSCTREAEALQTAIRFDSQTGQFVPTSEAMSGPRNDHGSVLLPDGQVLLVGGVHQGQGGCPNFIDRYDPVSDTFKSVGDTIQTGGCGGGDGHPFPILDNGNILLINAFRNRIEEYNPVTELFSLKRESLQYRGSWSVTVLQSGQILVAGGRAPRSESSYDFAEIYDPTNDVVISTIKLNGFRGDHTATLLTNGQVLLTGGGSVVEAGVITNLRSAELFIPD